MKIFKPEMWDDIRKYGWDHDMSYRDKDAAANIANRIFKEWLEKNGVKVYKCEDFPHTYITVDTWQPFKYDNSTHEAYLINIQEIKKECVEHEPRTITFDSNEQTAKCKHCGVALVAEWKVKDE